MKKLLILLVAGVCILAGLITFWIPIPTGIPLLAFGIFLVVATSRPAARRLQQARHHSGWLDRGLTWIEDRAGGRFARVMRRTRPRRRPATGGRPLDGPAPDGSPGL